MNLALGGVELPIRLQLEKPLTDVQLLRFCAVNEMVRVERDAKGELILLSPTGLEGSSWNSELITELNIWVWQDGRGKVFDSNDGFTLPDGSMRTPDAA